MGGTYTYNPPDKQYPDAQKADPKKTKHRIYKLPEFDSTIELDELSFPAEKNRKTQKLEDTASVQYPLIRINNYLMNKGEIDYFTIDCTEFLPKITLKCTFIHQTFISREMPKDGDIISIAIRNKTDLLNIIRNDYVITRVVSNKNPTLISGPITMTFYGILFIPWIQSTLDFAHSGTSFETFKKLAKILKLGFSTNEDNTNDKQIWISGNLSMKDFINNTVKRSWRDDSSFYDIWIDIYYNLNFININKGLLSAEDEVDVGAFLDNVDKDYAYGLDTGNTIETAKVFSNYPGYRTSSFFIINWKPNNKSTAITQDIGAKIIGQMFEHNSKLYLDPNSEKFWELEISPTYDNEKTNKYILLRGRTTFDASINDNELARANHSYIDMYKKYPWLGTQYTLSNPERDSAEWDGNQHRNYLRAQIQNLINNKELEKLNLEITVNGTNFNLIKGEKVPVVIINNDSVENMMINKESQGMEMLDQFYSGWYIVKGFTISWAENNSPEILTNFSQKFILTRREWPPPIATDAIKVNENQ